MKSSTKEIGNANFSGRVKQLFVLIIAILIGMLVSITMVDAKDFGNESMKRNRSVYKKQSVNDCHALAKKRSVSTNKVVKQKRGVSKFR
jgi:hypothetical protein